MQESIDFLIITPRRKSATHCAQIGIEHDDE